MEKIKYNELPVITFRWLRANHLDLVMNKEEISSYKGDYIVSGKEFVKVLKADELLEDQWLGKYKGTNEEELNKSLKMANLVHYIESDKDEREVRFKYKVSLENENIIERNYIRVKRGESLTLILEYESDEGGKEVSTLNLIEVEEGGNLKLFKINHLGKGIRHIDQRYTRVEKDGNFHFTSVDIGAKETVVNYENDLIGDKAKGSLDSIYLVNEDRVLDLAHKMNHFGKECNSNMNIIGALSDKAKKYFRGTLDFIKGSTGSEGGEIETVTLLDPTVRSYAIPLLLCGEHDVIGNHAASAGQIDEEKLFYLMSRGFNVDEAKKIIVESSFRPIIDSIPYEDIREAILQNVEKALKKVD